MHQNLNWKQSLAVVVAGLLSIAVVADVEGGIFRRRRGTRNNTGYVYGNAGVNAAVTGANIVSPPNVNAMAPGMNVRAGANANLPGANTDANLRVRGQTPDAEVKAGIDAASKPNGTPALPAPTGSPLIP